jgi:predicted nucleic acid-binding protein
MKSLVIDASAAVARLRGEDPAAAVDRLLVDTNKALLVPALFWIELINVLARKHRLSSAEVLEAIYEVEEWGIETVDLDRAGRLSLLDLTERFRLSAYDATYLALAEASRSRLLTADRNLARAAGPRAMLVGPGGIVSEKTTQYEVEPTWPTWRGAAAYLGELRRQAAEELAASS